MYLTDREQQIVALLRRDPLIGSAAIAEQLATTRSAVNVHLSNLSKKGVILGRGYLLGEQPGVVVIGGANIDVKARSTAPAALQTSNPGHGSMTPGGVGRNVAENLARLGTRTHLIAALGRDALGDNLLAQTAASGVRTEFIQRTERPTGTYTAILDSNGELIVAVADMAATDDLGPDHLSQARDIIATAGLLVLDGNLAPATLDHARDLADAAQVRTILEPVSVPKAKVLRAAIRADRPLYAVTPNRDELAALSDLPTRTDRQLRLAADSLHRQGVDHVWVRLGARGSLLSSASTGVTSLPAIPTTVEDVTGAGDSMLAAFCHALLEGQDPVDAARYGHAAAALTIASPHTVRPDLTPRMVRATLTPIS
ncbi:winged helix-turn-helix transcriptional regulator [Nostocoides sp. F2B08]|uniref:carbohydrate kinase n=1 Tax=Nostocoides sp. F2B08 TaxID=2653936 RepID=UPI001263489A|nr:carbohydrate kinase [Tetrasphaera sp. F2B08]KAB7739565.1 winged helix-turn-helix transcriptional regulator [Tetrasphaera sp. F2B08]